MAAEELERVWRVVTSELCCARALLPEHPVEHGGSVAQYDEFVEHNELELALDALEALGIKNPVPSDFWLQLRSAAEKMGLTEAANRIGSILGPPQ